MENSLTRNTLPNKLRKCHDEGIPCGGHTNKCFPIVVCSNKFKCTEGKGHASCFMSFSNICGPSAEHQYRLVELLNLQGRGPDTICQSSDFTDIQ